MVRRSAAVIALILFAGACTASSEPGGEVIQVTHPEPVPIPTATTPPSAPPSTTPPAPTTTAGPLPLTGTVMAFRGPPLSGATVVTESGVARTGPEGTFTVSGIPRGRVAISKPGWQTVTTTWDGTGRISVMLAPRVVRALRVAKNVAGDAERFDELLNLAAGSVVNALIFDTKDESGRVLYQTRSATARRIGAVESWYDPASALASARRHGLYAITRIVTFEDVVWTDAEPAGVLAGTWMDPADPRNWVYPLQLAVEACELGFDEVQFDYVRYPTGRASRSARSTSTTETERTAAIAAFLTEARTTLHSLGCAVSADVFAIIMATPDDQGIGQTPETVGPVVDAVSPMIYPGHYSDGWMGFEDPNDHPGPVVARALDDGAPRVALPTVVRPWLQAFGYTAKQVLASIAEAEARGTGWMLWNATGSYDAGWLPRPTLPAPRPPAV
ncbi:MAG: putative glycoside hydrolase [Acidimicrobiia bacterium]